MRSSTFCTGMSRRSLSIFMTVLLFCQTGWAQSTQSGQKSQGEIRRETRLRTSVESMGIGADVNVILGTKEKRRGVIREISSDAFALDSKGEPAIVRYDAVTKLRLNSLGPSNYKATGSTDSGLVQQVIAGIGVGETAWIKVSANKELHGTIGCIGKDSVDIDQSKGMPTRVAYSEIVEIRNGKTPLWKRAGMIPLIVVAVGIIVLLGINIAPHN